MKTAISSPLRLVVGPIGRPGTGVGFRASAGQRRHRVDADVDGARAVDVGTRTGPVLWRPRPQQEHAVRAHAGVRELLADHGAVVHLRLLVRIHDRQRVLREHGSAVPRRRVRLRDGCVRARRHVQQGHADVRDRVRRVPSDVRGDHVLPDPGLARRAHQVLGRAAVPRHLVHVRVHPRRAHGLVLGGSGRVHRRSGG